MVNNSILLTNKRKRYLRSIIKNWQLYIFIAPAFLYILIFNYFPIYGVQLAFKEFSLRAGITGSPLANPFYKYFQIFLNSYTFQEIIYNTVSLSLYGIIAGFPLPIILAILLNELNNKRFMKIVQNVTYAPHFISVVVLVSMVNLFFSYTGLINQFVRFLGGSPVNFFMNPSYFPHLYIWSGIWANMGYSSIIYFASLSGVPPELHEAAIIDGASRLQRIWNINLPHIRPTIVILLILNTGSIMTIGFEKVFLMQSAVNLTRSEVISTYVYKLGIIQRSYSLGSAVGLFNNIINLVILLLVNWIAARISESSLF